MSNNVKVNMGSENPVEDEPVEDEVFLDHVDEEDDVDDVEDDFDAPATLDDYPDDEEIWEGGPTVAQAKAWKAEYGRIIAGTLDNGDHYLIRPLNRAEYKNHVISLERSRNENSPQSAETLGTEEVIALIGLLWPQMNHQEISASGPAGLPTLLSQQILEISGFVAVQTTELF